MYIAPGQGQKTPWGQTFDVNRKPLSESELLLVTRSNDNHSPGSVIREVSP